MTIIFGWRINIWSILKRDHQFLIARVLLLTSFARQSAALFALLVKYDICIPLCKRRRSLQDWMYCGTWLLMPFSIVVFLFISEQMALKGFENQSNGSILKQSPGHNWTRCVRNSGTLHLIMVAGKVVVCHTCNALDWYFISIVFIGLISFRKSLLLISEIVARLFDVWCLLSFLHNLASLLPSFGLLV